MEVVALNMRAPHFYPDNCMHGLMREGRRIPALYSTLMVVVLMVVIRFGVLAGPNGKNECDYRSVWSPGNPIDTGLWRVRCR
jgi:hypothetical protein